MSRKISHSVTLNSVSISNIKEEIFLQPIDQHYQKTKDPYEFEDAAKFFIEYEQRHTINKIINMIAESDFSTDCGSYSTVSKSLDINDEQNFLKAGQKKISFTKIFLVEKWEKNIEEFIMKQNKKLGIILLFNIIHYMEILLE